jgi:hypothetical protein
MDDNDDSEAAFPPIFPAPVLRIFLTNAKQMEKTRDQDMLFIAYRR